MQKLTDKELLMNQIKVSLHQGFDMSKLDESMLFDLLSDKSDVVGDCIKADVMENSNGEIGVKVDARVSDGSSIQCLLAIATGIALKGDDLERMLAVITSLKLIASVIEKHVDELDD